MSILRHREIDMEIRDAYLRIANARRRGEDIEPGEIDLGEEQIAELAANEQFILTITENGYGKRSSAYEYRVTRRGSIVVAHGRHSYRHPVPVVSGERRQVEGEGVFRSRTQRAFSQTDAARARVFER